MTQTASPLTYLFASISDSTQWETLLWAAEFTCSKGNTSVCRCSEVISVRLMLLSAHVMLPRFKVPLLEVILQRQSDVHTRRNGKAGRHEECIIWEVCSLWCRQSQRENEHNNLNSAQNCNQCLVFFPPLRGMFRCLWTPPLAPPSTEPLIPSMKSQTSVKSTTCGFMST